MIEKRARRTGPFHTLRFRTAPGSVATRKLCPVSGQLVFLNDSVVLQRVDFRFELSVLPRQIM